MRGHTMCEWRMSDSRSCCFTEPRLDVGCRLASRSRLDETSFEMGPVLSDVSHRVGQDRSARDHTFSYEIEPLEQ